jgi:electron transport complex protein RnfG
MRKFISESWLVVVLGVVFAGLLAGTQTVMKPRIEVNEKAEMQQAIAEVVPGLVGKPEELKEEIAGCPVYRCLNAEGGLAGWAVVAEGGGFIDKIKLVVGLSPDGSEVYGMKVVRHLETPGLGNRIETKGEENPYPLQYEGKSTNVPLELIKGEPAQPYQIQAITGATYSSQYVLDIVNRVLTEVVPRLPKE